MRGHAVGFEAPVPPSHLNMTYGMEGKLHHVSKHSDVTKGTHQLLLRSRASYHAASVDAAVCNLHLYQWIRFACSRDSKIRKVRVFAGSGERVQCTTAFTVQLFVHVCVASEQHARRSAWTLALGLARAGPAAGGAE